MAKKLSTQDKIKRLRSEGYSRKELARSFGVSVSSIGRAERGAKGTTIGAQTDQFYKLGKRAKQSVVSGAASLPSARQPVKREGRKPSRIIESVSPLRKAEGKASALPSDAQVVVQVTIKGTGKSRTLYAHGGVWIGEIKHNLRQAITSQYGRQYGGTFDFDDVIDISIDEY